MRFSEAKKQKIVNEVLQDKNTIARIAEKYGIARKTIYSWIKRKDLSPKYKKGKKHKLAKYPKAYSYINRWVVKHPEWGCRTLSKQLETNGILLSHVQVNKLLNSIGAENYDRRVNYARNYAGPGRRKADVRHEVVQKALHKNACISRISEEYKLARKTIYSWIKKYQAEHNLDDNYVSAENHPRAIYPELTQKVLDVVVANPSYSVHTLSKMLPASSWTVWSILNRNNLNTISERLAYAQSRPVQKQSFVSQFFGRNKTAFEAVTPSNLPAPPPFKTFFQSFFLSFLVFIGLINLFSVVASVGMVFAVIALAMGTFFFLYSLKYYLSLAIVLSYSQHDDQTSIDKDFGNRKNLFDYILGNKNTVKLKTPGLESNLDNIKLKHKPFVSVQVALFNEKNVVERLCKSLTSFDYPEYEIILADDSTDETSKKITQYQSKYLFKGEKLKVTRGSGWYLSEVEVRPGVILKHLHRQKRDGYKGAALDLALKLTDKRAKYISVFDADFVPYPDTLVSFLKYFEIQQDTKVAAVQGYQWHVLNKSENWITRGVRSEYSGSYVIERAGEEIYGGLKQISGSVYMIKKEILEEIGWGRSITEDFELTLKLYQAGYKVAYTPYIQAPAECVSTLNRLIKQRMRWAEGHSQNIKKMFKPLMFNPKLSGMEKLEFLYLSPYYLQAFFFLVGTFSWLISETIFKTSLPFWTELWGWSLVLTNMISLPLVNAVGLFMEEGEQKDYSGLGSFIALSYILVPFQAYASVKGFLEKEEGGWFRTPKSGIVTDTFTRGRFMRFIQGIVPARDEISHSRSGIDLAINTANSTFNKFNIRKSKNRRWMGRAVLGVLLLISTTLVNYIPYIENYESKPTSLNSGIVGKQNKKQSFKLVSEAKAYSDDDLINMQLDGLKITAQTNSFRIDQNPALNIEKENNIQNIFYKIFAKDKNEIIKVSLKDNDGKIIKKYESNGFKDKITWSWQPEQTDKPGKYSLDIEHNGQTLTYDFTWGVLAINTNKSIFAPGENANLAIAVLDEQGEMVCDAKLNLKITDPNLNETNLSTIDDTITVTPGCHSKEMILNPDYQAEYLVGETGRYQMKLSVATKNGEYSINDSFEVKKEVGFDVERITATRIYPLNIYPVIFKVTPRNDFSGIITERVPQEFEISEITDDEINRFTGKNGSLDEFLGDKQVGDTIYLEWLVNWQAGETYYFGYKYDAPDKSPQLYNLGPLQVDEWIESRLWQIAVDAPVADFNVQRGCVTTANSTATLTAGSEYTAPADNSSAFIALTNTRLTGTGDVGTGGDTGTQEADDFTWYISDPDFSGGSVQFTRAGNTDTVRLCWEIVEYVGATSGANEMKVRGVGTATYTTTGTTVDGSSVSGVVDDSDVVVFITGQNSVETADEDEVNAGFSTSEWVGGATDVPRFTRGFSGSDANSLSYAVVEFAGSNWGVERKEHTFSADATEETETIANVGSTARAFFHAQFRLDEEEGLDDSWAEMWLSSTTTVSFQTQAASGSLPSQEHAVVWVVHNTDTNSDTDMQVQHISGSRAASATSEGTYNEEDEWTDSITAVSATTTTSIMGMSGRSAGNGTAYPRGSISAYLNSTTGVKLWQSDDGQPQNYRFQVVEWPLSDAPSTITISGTANGNDTATVKYAVNGTPGAETDTIGSSSWEITGITAPSPDDIITVWVDGVADGSESTAATKYSSGDVTDMVLDTNVLTLGSNQGTSLSISNLDTYDCTADEDIMYQAGSSHLKVEGDSCAGSTTNSYSAEKLEILSGDTLTVGTSETLTTYDLTIAGTLTSSGNSTYNVAHNWAKTGTFTSDTSTVNLIGADSSTQTLSGSTSFYNLSVSTNTNSAGRTVRFTYDTTQTVTGTWTVTGYSGKVITLESSTTSAWTINPTAASVTYASVSYSTNAGASFCATYSTDGNNNNGWNISDTGTCPNPTASTASFQRKTWHDGDYYWRSFLDTTDNRIEFEYSSDGDSWTEDTSARIDVDTSDFSVWADDTQAYIAYKTSAVTNEDNLLTDSALVGYWKMNEGSWSGSADEVVDSSGNGNHGVRSDNATTTTGKFNNGGTFDGTGDYVTMDNDSSLIPGAAASWSMSAWIKPADADQIGMVYEKTDISTAEGYAIFVSDDFVGTPGRKIAFALVENGTGDRRKAITTADVADGNWHHVAGVFNQSTDSVTVYIDGVAVSVTTDSAGDWPTVDNTESLRIGSFGGIAYSYSGQTDDMRIYSRVLTADEVKILAQPGYDIEVRKASSYPGTGFSWGDEEVALNGSASSNAMQYPTITQDDGSKIWVSGSRYDTGTPAYAQYAVRSTNTSDISLWDTSTSLDSSTNTNRYGVIVPRTSNAVYAIWMDGTTIEGKNYNGSSWDGSPTGIDTGLSGLADTFSAVSDSSGNVYLTFIDDETTDQVSNRTYTSSWSSAALVADATSNTDSYPTLSLDTTNGDLYAFWIDTSTSYIYYATCAISTACDDASEWDEMDEPWQNSGPNTFITSSYHSDGPAFAQWLNSSTLNWDYIIVPEYLWLALLVGPIMPFLSKLRKKKYKD